MPQLHYSIQIEQDPLTVHNVLVDKEAYGTWTYSFSKQSDFIGDWSEGSQIMFTFVEPRACSHLALHQIKIQASRSMAL